MGKIMIEPGILMELMDFGVLEFFFLPLLSDKPCMPESLKSSFSRPPQIAALLQVLCLRLYGSQGVGKENGRSLWDLVHVKLEITFLDLVCTQ
jgi:hypothetical protein